jgi:hypothetical protein
MDSAIHPLATADLPEPHDHTAAAAGAPHDAVPDEADWSTRWRSSPLLRGASPLTAYLPWGSAPGRNRTSS